MNCSVSTEVQGARFLKLCSLCVDKFAAEEYAAIITKAEGLHITISIQHVLIFLLPPLEPARPIAEQSSPQSGWDLTLYLSDVVLILLKLTGEGSGPITVLVPRAGEHLHPEVCIRETGKVQDLPADLVGKKRRVATGASDLNQMFQERCERVCIVQESYRSTNIL